MFLKDIRDWLKGVFPQAEHFYIGKLDVSEEKAIGVYQGDPRKARRCVGPTTYAERSVSILVHWTNNARETEGAAQQLYDLLKTADRPVIGGHTVPFIALEDNEPQDCTGGGSIYESVINAVFYVNL